MKPVVFLARLSEEGPPYLPRTGITRAAGRSAGLRLGPSSQLLTVREPKFAPVNARIGKGISSFMWVHVTLDATREASSLPRRAEWANLPPIFGSAKPSPRGSTRVHVRTVL